MSSRVMNSFNYFVPDVEVYSIDEAFLNLQGFDNSIIYQKMVNMRRDFHIIKKDSVSKIPKLFSGGFAPGPPNCSLRCVV